MTRDEAREAAKVLQHYADGGDVQYRPDREEEWKDGMPLFNFINFAYRIKPKPAEGWGTINDNGDCPLMYSSEEDARMGAACGRRVFHWREVTE